MMNNYLEWDRSYSSARRLAKWEREENKKIFLYILTAMVIESSLFYLFLHVL